MTAYAKGQTDDIAVTVLCIIYTSSLYLSIQEHILNGWTATFCSFALFRLGLRRAMGLRFFSPWDSRLIHHDKL